MVTLYIFMGKFIKVARWRCKLRQQNNESKIKQAFCRIVGAQSVYDGDWSSRMTCDNTSFLRQHSSVEVRSENDGASIMLHYSVFSGKRERSEEGAEVRATSRKSRFDPLQASAERPNRSLCTPTVATWAYRFSRPRWPRPSTTLRTVAFTFSSTYATDMPTKH